MKALLGLGLLCASALAPAPGPEAFAGPVAVAGSLSVAQDGGPDKRRLTSAPDRRVELDFQHYYKTRELRTALSSLSAAYPEFLQMESLGKSRGNEDLWMVRLAEAAGSDPESRPALFVVASQSLSDVQGTELALAALVELLQNHAREERVGRMLRERTVYFVPCANPDLRGTVLGALESGSPSSERWPARVDLERNYPVGWSPFARAGELSSRDPGPYALSEPESLQVSLFLERHVNVAALVAFAPLAASEAPEAGTGFDQPGWREPASLRAFLEGALQQSGARFALRARIVEPRGSLDDFAFGQLGVLPLRILCGEPDPESGLALPRTEEIGPEARRVAAALLALAEGLPRLEIAGTSVQRLKNDLWQVELTVGNSGGMRTQSILGSERRAADAPRLSIRGGKVAGCGLRTTNEDVYLPLALDEGELTLVELEPGGQVRVRALIAAPAETSVEIVATSPRGGSSATTIVLR